MTAPDARPVFHLPARDIPVPSSISEQAQAMLAMGPLMPDPEYPPLDDREDEPEWLLPDAATMKVAEALFRPTTGNRTGTLPDLLAKFLDCQWPLQFLPAN